ncbi:hypothetical protein I3I95_10540 [bacterium]|nr:hypothetical protein [bacterium]
MADMAEGEGAKPQGPGGGEGAKPQDPQRGEPVNRRQYDREIERRDRKIAELEAQLKAANDAKASDGGKAAQALREVSELKAQLADERVNARLAEAGCVDAKCAKARLDEFGGDVAKLKEAAPYLFGAKAVPRSTGGEGSGGGDADGLARLRRIAGLEIKKG